MMDANLLKDNMIQGVAYLGSVFTQEKLKEVLFEYYGTTEVDVSYTVFYKRKKGKDIKELHTVIINPQSVLLPDRVAVLWDNPGDFTMYVYANVHEGENEPSYDNVVCQMKYFFDSDLRLKNIQMHHDDYHF
jgi:hypothetical protein